MGDGWAQLDESLDAIRAAANPIAHASLQEGQPKRRPLADDGWEAVDEVLTQIFPDSPASQLRLEEKRLREASRPRDEGSRGSSLRESDGGSALLSAAGARPGRGLSGEAAGRELELMERVARHRGERGEHFAIGMAGRAREQAITEGCSVGEYLVRLERGVESFVSSVPRGHGVSGSVREAAVSPGGVGRVTLRESSWGGGGRG